MLNLIHKEAEVNDKKVLRRITVKSFEAVIWKDMGQAWGGICTTINNDFAITLGKVVTAEYVHNNSEQTSTLFVVQYREMVMIHHIMPDANVCWLSQKIRK